MAKKRSSHLYELNKIIGNRVCANQGVRIEQRGHDDGQLKIYTLPNTVLYDDDEFEDYENVNPPPLTDQQMQGRQYENIAAGQATEAGNDSDKVIRHMYENQDVVICRATKPSIRTELDAEKDRDTRLGLRVMKKSKACIATYIFLTALAVIVIIALVVGALGVRGSSKAQLAIDALEREITSVSNEMSELKSQLAQSQNNVSQESQLSNRHEKN